MDARWTMTAAAVLTAGALAACHPAKFGEGRNGADHALSVADRLDCPEEQGDLRRTIQAPDGRSCTYSGGDGETVTLSYLALDGKTPSEALAPTEASFRALLPGAADPERRDGWSAGVTTSAGRDHGDDANGETKGDSDDATAPAPPAPPEPPEPPAPSGKRDRVAINLPRLHIDANDDGASVRAFGQNIVADDKGATVDGAFNGSKTTIRADDDGAEIRAGFVGKQAVDLTYVLASDEAGPSGVHAASYVARGPVGGPLVLASGTLKEGDRHVDRDRFGDLRELVNRNVRRARR